MKHVLKVASALACLAGFSASPALATPEKPLIIYISGPLGGNPFLRQGWEGAQKAAAELGGEARSFESADPTQHRQNLEAAAKAGADIVVAMTYEFDDLLPEAAANHPETKYLHIDSCPKKLLPNITCVTFREYEVNFLAGVEAALTTKTGKVGAISALDIPYLHRYTDSFAEGAKYAKPDIEVVPPLWVGGDRAFSDPARGQQRAVVMLSQGADRILAAASGSNGGIFNSLADFPDTMAMGVDINECPSAPGYIMDNIEKRTDVAAYQLAVGIMKGTAKQQSSLGLEEGGMTLTGIEPGVENSQCEIAKYPEVIAKLKSVRQDIIDGKIKVEDPMFAK